MTERGSFARGLPAHAAHFSNAMSSPLFPASQTIGLAPGTERYGTSPARDGAEKNGRRHGSSALRRPPQVGPPHGASVDRGDSLARKRIDGSQACPRVGIVLQRSVVEIAAQRSAKASHSPSGSRPSRGRELDLEVTISDGVRRKAYVGPGASSDRAILSWDQPTPIGGAHRMTPDGERPGSMTCSIARARATEGRRFGSLRGRHPSRDGGSTRAWPRREARRSSERTARETRRGDRGVRGQDRNVFRSLETRR